MKFKFTFILLVLIGQFFSLTAREVTSFNEGWLFKRGPFSEDPVKVVAQWEGKWETVNLPHTWNAKDMQVKLMLSMKELVITGKHNSLAMS